MSKKRAIKRRALMAILLAGGLVNTPVPVSALPESNPGDSDKQIFEKVARNTRLPSSERAYHLLLVAGALLNGSSSDELAKNYKQYTENGSGGFSYRINRHFKSSLRSLADQAAQKDLIVGKANSSLSQKNFALAKSVMLEAFPLISPTVDPYFQMSMYLIARGKFRELGDAASSKKCDDAIEKFVSSCEKDGNPNSKQLEAAASVLDSQSQEFIRITIFDQKPSYANRTKALPISYSEENFRKAQKLRLRAIALLDRLAPENHLRRKAHRDMALWYSELGKDALANAQKEALFDLVGVQSDNILYPQSGGCGSLIWWKAEAPKYSYDCGMG
ncbi:MAG: hypothetical protein H6677_10605 [Candidatus Obscuribacterales bacterium]|nr:hypothetical protein [Cyanobacteria bacterium HKST-UBA01]MCB9468717.1 hypothetical protein [Candidatus Obscuribacterales bacterium]